MTIHKLLATTASAATATRCSCEDNSQVRTEKNVIRVRSEKETKARSNTLKAISRLFAPFIYLYNRRSNASSSAREKKKQDAVLRALTSSTARQINTVRGDLRHRVTCATEARQKAKRRRIPDGGGERKTTPRASCARAQPTTTRRLQPPRQASEVPER